MNLVETLEQWRSDDLRPYVYVLSGNSSITRKADRINFIAQALEDAGLSALLIHWDTTVWK